MKILIAAQYYYPYRSGLTEYARLVAEDLATRGYDVTVLTSRSSPDLAPDEDVHDVRVIRLPVLLKMNRGAFMPGFLPALMRLSKSADIVNLHFPMPECAPATYLLRNQNVVVTYHCDLTLEGGLLMKTLQAIYFRLQSASLRYPRAIVVNSREYAADSALAPFMKGVVPIPPPIKDLRRAESEAFIERFKISGAPIIGFLGRVVFEKGLDDLIHAMDFILNKLPEARLVIGGEKEKVAGGTVTDKLIEMSRKHGAHILFTGFLEDELLEAFYSACDVFVLPSTDRLESFGMVQVEAMLCGTPVVATKRPGMSIPIRTTRMGCLVPPRNPKTLAEGIIEVIQHRDQYLIDRSKILEHFGVARTVDAYEKLFKEMSGKL